MDAIRPLWCCGLVLVASLLAACGDDSGPTVQRGCTPDHDASGTYRLAPAYLDERLLLLEESLRVEERPYDREALAGFVEGMREAWQDAALVLRPDGTFTLTGVVHAKFGSKWKGAWDVGLDTRECKLHLTGSGAELHALLGDGWTSVWAEEPQPGVVLDVLLVRDGRGEAVR